MTSLCAVDWLAHPDVVWWVDPTALERGERFAIAVPQRVAQIHQDYHRLQVAATASAPRVEHRNIAARL
jgi:hypothetical protein